MKHRLFLFTGLFLLLMSMQMTSSSQVKIGVFADCQYCDCETAGTRYYRNSLQKLNECIVVFNQTKNIDFVVGLGDLIDKGISSFDSVNEVLHHSKHKIYHVIGNHDLAVEKADLEKVPKKLNMKETWYSFTKKEWRFIFLNGNDITFHSNNAETKRLAEEMTNELKEAGKPNFHDWNGGIGKKQMKWLASELQQAKARKQNVAVFCHYPILPFEAHALWNSEELLAVLTKYNNVKLYLNGHNHAGNYAFHSGIHFVNLKGMVETEMENAFSIVSFSADKIEIKGFGRENTKNLLFE